MMTDSPRRVFSPSKNHIRQREEKRRHECNSVSDTWAHLPHVPSQIKDTCLWSAQAPYSTDHFWYIRLSPLPWFDSQFYAIFQDKLLLKQGFELFSRAQRKIVGFSFAPMRDLLWVDDDDGGKYTHIHSYKDRISVAFFNSSAVNHHIQLWLWRRISYSAWTNWTT